MFRHAKLQPINLTIYTFMYNITILQNFKLQGLYNH